MRNVVSLALLAVASASLFACSDAGTGGGYLARRHAQPPAPGSQEQHDDSDTEGANDTDPGNPNANTPPPAPTDPGSAAELSVALSTNTPAVDLGDSTDIDVTIEPKSAFNGSVTLSATGLPAGVQATFAPATVTVSDAPVTSKLTLTVARSAVPSAPNASSPIVITAKSGDSTATANANFKVNPKMTLTIPLNIDALRAAGGTQYRNEWGTELGANQVPLKTQVGNGIVFTVYNADSTSHIIHGANGFAHGDTGNAIKPNSFEMQNGAPRTRTLNVGANANGYLHEGANGSSVSFRIKIEDAAQ